MAKDITANIELRGGTLETNADIHGLIRIKDKNGWPIPDAMLIGTADYRFTLKEDTIWDEWTPTTAQTTIKKAGESSIEYPTTAEDMLNNCFIFMQFDEAFPVYAKTPSSNSVFTHRINSRVFVYYPIEIPDLSVDGSKYVEMRNVTHSHALDIYLYNGVRRYAADVSYGFGPGQGFNLAGGGAIADGRKLVLREPEIVARCSANSGRFPVEAASCIDSEKSYVTVHQRAYIVPKERMQFAALFSSLPTTLFDN